MKNEVSKTKNNLPKEYLYKTHTKIIKATDSELEIPFEDVLDKILNLINVADIVENIQKEAEYVVQIPKEFQKQYESGEYWIMKNLETEKEWPTLMRKGDDGKNKIVTPLAIKKESFIQGNPIQDLTQQIQMAQLQHSIQEQNELLESICKTVKHIQKGQMNDRIALLESGRDQISFALQRDDSDPGKRTAIESGIRDMITARNQIFEELKLQCNDFQSVPKSKLFQSFKEILHADYYENTVNEYNEIADLFELYKESTKYIAIAHILINQPNLINTVYSNSLKKLEDVDYSKVKSISYWDDEENVSLFFNCDNNLLLEDQKECIQLNEDFDSLAIETNGEQLLEAISHGREKSKARSEEASEKSKNY